MTNSILNFLSAHALLVKLAAVLVGALFLHWLVSFIFARLHPRLEKTKHVWDHTLLKALQTPLVYFIWIIVLTLLVPMVLNFAHSSFDLMRQIFIVVFLFWFMMRYIRFVEQRVISKPELASDKRERTNIRAITQVLRIVVFILAVLGLMQIFKLPITTLLAFGSVGGLAVGFAAKDTIANFFGGMMIFWDKPFEVGDWIKSPDRNIEGTVENIGWRLTRIHTFDKRPLYVPNGLFSTISVENPSRMTNRRIKTTIGLRYDDATKIEHILKDIEDMLRNHPEIDTNQTLMVNLIEFGASSLNFFIYTFTKTTNWVKFQAIQQDVFLKTIAIITEHGAECAFPTSTTHIPDGLVVNMNKTEEVG